MLQAIPVFPYNMVLRFCYFVIVFFGLNLAGVAVAQDSPPVEQLPIDKSSAPKDNARLSAPDNACRESSSTQTRIDVAPPTNDTKAHPEAGSTRCRRQ